jgi:hypothetical protein
MKGKEIQRFQKQHRSSVSSVLFGPLEVYYRPKITNPSEIIAEEQVCATDIATRLYWIYSNSVAGDLQSQYKSIENLLPY